MKGKGSPEDDLAQHDVEASGGAAAEKSEKSDYDYLLGMNLWSLTFEKVEELKKQHEVKVVELNELKKTTIEMMWDRDLEALSKGLDEIDALEAEELEAGNIAAAGRRKQDASRQATRGATRRPAGPPRVRGGGKRATDDDEAMLSRPLQAGPEGEGNSAPEIVKTTWGTGAPKTRANTQSDPKEEAAPAQKVPRRAAGGGARGGSG